jgi:hypothetical protein
MNIKPLLTRAAAIAALALILINLPGCSKIENLSDSASKLICELIVGEDLEGNSDSTTIFIDVITSSGSIVNDNATATLSVVLLDPLVGAGTHYQDVTVDQIDIEYSRSDMPDAVQGKDIPYNFSQKVYARIPVAGSIDLPFIIVRHAAKFESPLVELVNMGQEKILKLEVRVTFHAVDGAGHRVKEAVGAVSVWCANFADDD